MNWFLIALAAPILWSVVNVADKYLVSNYSRDNQSSGSLALFSSLVGICLVVIIGIFTRNIFSVYFFDRLLLILIGIFDFCWIILYLFALEIDDVSSVVPWMQLIPVFGYLLGFIFLRETLTPKELLGAVIIFIGSIIISIDFSKIKILFKKKVAGYMVLGSLIYAVNGVIFKFVSTTGSFWASSFWQYAGLSLAGIFVVIFFGKWRKQFFGSIKSGGLFIFSINSITESMTIAGNLLTNFAVLLAPVAMVYLVSAFQPFIVLLMTFICTKAFPRVVNEDFGSKILVPKLIALFFMLVGSMFLFI